MELLLLSLLASFSFAGDIHSAKCYVLDSAYKPTSSTFVVQNFRATEAGDTVNLDERKYHRISNVQNYTFPSNAGMSINEFKRSDFITYYVGKRPRLANPDDFANSYRIVGFTVQIQNNARWGHELEQLKIESKFNLGHPLPHRNRVLTIRQRLFGTNEENLRIYNWHLFVNGFVGGIFHYRPQAKIKSAAFALIDLVQCESSSETDDIYVGQANH